MRRLNFKLLFLLSVFLVLVISNIYLFYGHNNSHIRFIKCLAFGQFGSSCAILAGDIYMPSSDILRLFDLFGYYDDKAQTFNLKTNNINLSNSDHWQYDSTGPFLFFAKYDVDIRSKVKIISVDDNVPISSQWDKNGYEYPIQIAQYGLSHYSKYKELESRKQLIKPLILIDSTDLNQSYTDSVMYRNDKYLKFTLKGVTFHSDMIIQENNLKRLISLSYHGNKIHMGVVSEYVKNMPKILSDLPELFLIGSNWKVGSGLHIHIKNALLGYMSLVYVCGPTANDQDQRHNIFVYSIENCDTIKLVRNLYVDILKRLPTSIPEHNFDISSILKNSYIADITIYGFGQISTFKLSNQFSFDKFIVAADWFILRQNAIGGWPTNVTRRIYPSVTLAPGWHSAMAQGHGISLLVRAYHITNDEIYLKAATNALQMFEISSENHGIVTTFLQNKDLIWYEEYPTYPSLFVLNGFLYSLFGLLDYSKIAKTSADGERAAHLLRRGLFSLQTLLPLFDSGFGTFYDLRHLTFPAAGKKITKKSLRPMEVSGGPNRARWEYHIVHIEQLLYLGNSLSPKNIFLIETANRFTLYMKGYRSAHN